MRPELISDRYRVERPIGRGGMGTVWLCTDEILGREVAVKQVGLLPGESVTDSARALREARSSATLNHRNVVSVFDVTETDGSLWMVMEYVPSRTLAGLVREEGPLPPERVAAIGAQVAAGLAAAHAAGTIHRDVKPDNILVAEDGTAKIGDFGIARMHGDQPLTQSGFVTGTPSYFSPELAEGHDPGPAADVWALGATLYTAVEGAPPYPHERNPVAMLRTIAAGPPAPPRSAGFLEQPLQRMLDRDPSTRWSMADAAHALRRLADRHDPEGTRENTTAFPAGLAAARGQATSTAATSTADTATEAPRSRASAGGAGTADARTTADGRPAGAAAGGAAAGAGGGAPASDSPIRRDRRGPGLLALLAVLVVLLLVAGVGYVLLGRSSGSTDNTASGAGETSAPPSHSPSASSSASPSSSPTRSTSPTRATSPRRSISAFLSGYYTTVPGNLDAGWSKLGPHEQAQGRASYDRFWQSIDRVDASRLQPDPASSSADLTLTYHFKDGRVVVERQRLDLVRSSRGGWLINDDTVLSSRTVRG